MKECGFEFYNFRYECEKCNLRFVPFLERYFGENFVGRKWEEINA